MSTLLCSVPRILFYTHAHRGQKVSVQNTSENEAISLLMPAQLRTVILAV